MAASAALHEDDLAELVAPRGGTAGPLKYHIHDVDTTQANASSSAATALLNTAKIDWEVQGAAGLRDAESAAWMKLLDAGSEKKGLTESTFMSIAQPLISKAQKSRASLSYDLLCKLLLVAAGKMLFFIFYFNFGKRFACSCVVGIVLVCFLFLLAGMSHSVH
jgi:hypothetical protein